MNEQKAREFVEILAVPEPTDPSPCPLCGQTHPLETRCRHSTGQSNRSLEAAGLRE